MIRGVGGYVAQEVRPSKDPRISSVVSSPYLDREFALELRRDIYRRRIGELFQILSTRRGLRFTWEVYFSAGVLMQIEVVAVKTHILPVQGPFHCYKRGRARGVWHLPSFATSGSRWINHSLLAGQFPPLKSKQKRCVICASSNPVSGNTTRLEPPVS